MARMTHQVSFRMKFKVPYSLTAIKLLQCNSLHAGTDMQAIVVLGAGALTLPVSTGLTLTWPSFAL